jgi:hypothetical protein
MKKLTVLVLVLFIFYGLSAQINATSVQKRMWDEKLLFPDSAMYSLYKNESAVILHQSEVFEYTKSSLSTLVKTDNYARFQVWLLDESAVQEYSELRFSKLGISRYRREGTLIGIKVMKPDGSERIIDLNDAVKMQIFNNASEMNETSESYNKVAIKEIEVGDVIDFYIVNVNRVNSSAYNYAGYFAFDPEVLFLKSQYPIHDGKISLFVERDCHINLTLPKGYSYPELKEKDNKLFYEISYSNKEKLKMLQWKAPFVSEPVLRFQVIVAGGPFVKPNKHFFATTGTPKLEPEKSDFYRMLNYLTNNWGFGIFIHKETGKFLKGQRRRSDESLMINDLFYFIRNFLYFDCFNYHGMPVSYSRSFDEFDVIRTMSSQLRRRKIAHDVFIGVDKRIGHIDNVVIHEELTPGIRVQTLNGTVLLYSPGIFSKFNEPKQGLQGTKVVIGKVIPGIKGFEMGVDTLPLSKPNDNVINDSYILSFTGKKNQVNVNRNTQVSGCLRKEYNNFVWDIDSFLDDEAQVIQKICMLTSNQKKRRKIYANGILKNKSDYFVDRKKAVRSKLHEMNNIIDIDEDTIIVKALGRAPEEEYLSFQLNFKTNDIVSQAGDYLVVDLSKLFGKFASFPDDEKERNVDVYMDCPRSLQWHIEIIIPEGYSAGNLESFNDSIKNSTGGFECFAREEFGKVVLQAHKYYLHDYEPIANWPELLSMLEFSSKISQQKIVFSKILAE